MLWTWHPTADVPHQTNSDVGKSCEPLTVLTKEGSLISGYQERYDQVYARRELILVRLITKCRYKIINEVDYE